MSIAASGLAFAHATGTERDWCLSALTKLQREAARSADTHLLKIDLPGFPDIGFYFKDEAAHPTGSLKHRLARSLFLYALCNGRLHAGQTVVDASSGSTAISEAWFARLLGLPFTAVMPACTAPRKIRDVEALGGMCDLVADPGDVHARAAWHAARGACHLDQFGLAERATDWRGNNNIAESILQRWVANPIRSRPGSFAAPAPAARPRPLAATCAIAACTPACAWPIRPAARSRRLAHARSQRARHAADADRRHRPAAGRTGFVFEVVDEVIEVADADSIAAAWRLEELLGRRYGGSSGTNFIACLQLAEAMRARGKRGSIVSLLCDRGERYEQTLFDRDWLRTLGVDPAAAVERLSRRFVGI
jgi:cysteine synthase A